MHLSFHLFLAAAITFFGVKPTSSAKLPKSATGIDFNFGEHATDQCNDPVALTMNSNTLIRIPPRDDNNGCSTDFCLGDCVTIVIKDEDSQRSVPINVIVGAELPDPGNCSDPDRTWVFTHIGKCGQGDLGEGYWNNCLVHDVCVWARCTDDSLDTGFEDFRPTTNDKYCGGAYKNARKDGLAAHTFSCLTNDDCPDPLTCKVMKCKMIGEEGDYCDQDADCKGICHLMRCYDGTEGDRCGSNSDCQDPLICYGTATARRCSEKKGEGARCDSDSECKGYCHLMRCYNGSEGDKCGSDGDCEGALTCYGFATGKSCTRKKGEGARCGSDNDCLGYCQTLRCYDGSRGDKCKHNSDCQSNRCRKRCKFCAQRVCK